MATKPSDSQRSWSPDRFYMIDGRQLPSVTTILDVIAKPGLGPWYAKQERRYFRSLLLARIRDLGHPAWTTPPTLRSRGRERREGGGPRAATGLDDRYRGACRDRVAASDEAGRGRRARACPAGAAAWAVESWKDWASSVALEPLAIERTVYCDACGYAGTLDLYARVIGILTVLDWKSGKAIYPEAFLQNVAYRHAAKRLRMPSAQGLIVRLPKLVTDPTWEVMPVPTMLSIEDFLAAMRLWRWLRRMEGKPTGSSGGGAGYLPAA